jgi:hypothetical protein
MNLYFTDILAGAARVESCTDAGTWYTVAVTVAADGEPEYTCTCPAGAHGFINCRRLGYCKHVAAVMARLTVWNTQPTCQGPKISYTRRMGYCGRCGGYASDVVITYTTAPTVAHEVHICPHGHRAEISVRRDAA